MPGSLLLGGGIRVDDHHRFAQLAHALHHVGRAWGPPIPEHDEQVASLRHLVIAAHACGLPKALPVRGEAARADMVLERPAKAELIGAAGAAGEDLRDAMAFWRQRLAQVLIAALLR